MLKKISFQNLEGINLDDITDFDVLQQKEKFGSNNITDFQKQPLLGVMKDTLSDPMIWLLFSISVIFYFIGQLQESVSLFVAIIPLVFMDAYLHRRTQVSVDSLKTHLSVVSKVFRNGKEISIDSREIIPGDLILLDSNEHIPADGIFEEATNLQIDESTLTGESLPVQKTNLKDNRDTFYTKKEALISTDYLGLAGTRILRGSGKLRVLYTGKDTSYGEIIQSMSSVFHEKTPLQHEISRLVKILTWSSIVICIFLAFVRYLQGNGILDAFLSAATLAVAAVPEEFPVVFTFFLGVGVYRLSKKNALVRKAVTVENIGRVSCICTDKTGTITLGELKLSLLFPGDGISENELLKVSLVASDPVAIDPVDRSILEMSALKSISIPEKIESFPFTEDRKRESAFILEDVNSYYCCTKGAPETLLKISNLNPDLILFWQNKITFFASQGYKVLACAKKKITVNVVEQKIEPLNDFEFLGLLVFKDPPRAEVKEAIEYCKQNKIKVLMLTGDHLDTATAIAKEVGIGGISPVVVSAEVEESKFHEDFLKNNPNFIENVDVISRCTPKIKFNIVRSLMSDHRVVAVTGDGVNDVPALKAASVGIAMGERGTKSAKDVSSIILTDDNFSTIVYAIREGKQLFLNLSSSFIYLFLIHIPFVLTAALIPLIGYPILYLPIHVIWFELIIHPTALFSFQLESDEDEKIPRNTFSFLEKGKLISIFLMGLIVTIVIVVTYKRSILSYQSVNHARSMVLAVMSLWNVAIVFSLTNFKSFNSKIISVFTLLTSLVILQNGFISKKLHLQRLGFYDWILVFCIITFFLLILKLLWRWRLVNER